MKKLINQRDAKGRRHGVWENYWGNGTLRCREHWHHGKQHGVWEWYYSDGTLMWRGHYYHGTLHGVCENYWGNGTLWERVHFHHGKRHGVWEYYWSDGTLWRRGHYNMDLPVGREQEWGEKGEVVKSVDHGGQVPMAEVEADLVLLMPDPAEMFAPIKQDF